VSIPCRIALLLASAALALPGAAEAQTAPPTQTLPAQGSGSRRPPVELGAGSGKPAGGGRPSSSSSSAASRLPNTGSDPRLLFLTGVALTLLGAGLRLRTADADVY
jgi:LPXTG-motif cell wall-anchored protein